MLRYSYGATSSDTQNMYYKAVIILALAVGASSAVVKPPFCPTGYFGNVADPVRCDAFYFCANGLQINLFCATGYEFDGYLKVCVAISDGGCTLGSVKPPKIAESADFTTSAASAEKLKSAAPICPNGFFGHLAHPELCSSFYMCIGLNGPLLFNCADGLEFDPKITKCVTITTGGCTLGSAKPTKSSESESASAESAELTKSAELAESAASICPENYFGNIVHPQLCSAFYKCIGHMNPILLNCANGLEYDSELNDCVEITEGGCTFGNQVGTERTVESNTNQASSEPFSCPMEYFGTVPDPENCNAFYLCKVGVAIHLNCMAGFEFDYDLKICAEINDKGCTSRL